jgi:hypothetical protein
MLEFEIVSAGLYMMAVTVETECALEDGLKLNITLNFLVFYPKRALIDSHEGNKFCILDGTKHDPKNFGILHFITPK